MNYAAVADTLLHHGYEDWAYPNAVHPGTFDDENLLDFNRADILPFRDDGIISRIQPLARAREKDAQTPTRVQFPGRPHTGPGRQRRRACESIHREQCSKTKLEVWHCQHRAPDDVMDCVAPALKSSGAAKGSEAGKNTGMAAARPADMAVSPLLGR